MNSVTLTPEMERLVNERVASGKYQSPAQVVEEGLRLLKEREEMCQPDFMFSSIEELEEKLSAAANSLAQGKGIPADVSYRNVMQQLRKSREDAKIAGSA